MWRDRANFIIQTALQEKGKHEQLWARQVDASHFELCCVPFFAYDLALGDVVEAVSNSGQHCVVTRVTERSGRYVFRVWFGEAADPPRDVVAEQLVEMGALLEWQAETRNLLAVDARDLAHAKQLSAYLAKREQSGDLIFETGRTA